MTPAVELRYIPRRHHLEPRIRLTIFRSAGVAILDIGASAIAVIRRPRSEGERDLLDAFRASVPTMLATLNQTIAAIPPGGIAFVAAAHLRTARKMKAA
jgi:hypothetical protein